MTMKKQIKWVSYQDMLKREEDAKKKKETKKETKKNTVKKDK